MKKNVITHVKPLGVSNKKYYVPYAFIHLLYSERSLLTARSSQEEKKKEHMICRGLSFLGCISYT